MQIYDTIVLDLQYLPTLAYFGAIARAREVWIDIGEHYQKQSYRNRTQIITAGGVLALTVPVHAVSHQAVRHIQIDYTQKWQQQHWRTITSAYNKAPFWEYYAGYFEELYTQEWQTLVAFNTALLTRCLTLLKIPQKPIFSENYLEIRENSRILDLRSQIHPKRPTPAGCLPDALAYTQVFGNEFVPRVSIIDILANEGREAARLLNVPN